MVKTIYPIPPRIPVNSLLVLVDSKILKYCKEPSIAITPIKDTAMMIQSYPSSSKTGANTNSPIINPVHLAQNGNCVPFI